MPTYEYKCPKCGHTESRNQSVENRDHIPWCNHKVAVIWPWKDSDPDKGYDPMIRIFGFNIGKIN